jgi:hypothetical protein
MPSFKGIERGRSITGAGTGAKISPGVGTQLGQAIKSVGHGLGDIAAVAEKQRAKQRSQDRDNDFISAKSEYNIRLNAFMDEEESLEGLAADGGMDRLGKFRDEQFGEFTKDETDEAYKLILKQNFFGQTDTAMDIVARHGSLQRKKVSDSTYEKAISQGLKNAYSGRAGLDALIADHESTVMLQFDDGQIGSLTAEDRIVEGTRQLAEAALDGEINRDPAEAIESIKLKKYNKYLSREQRAAFDKEAKRQQKALDADAKAAKVEAERLAKVQKEEQRQEANKGLTDLYSVETLTRTAIEEQRDKLSSTDYQSWIDRQKKSVENKSKATGKVTEDITKKRGFEVEAMEMGPETTDSEAEKLRLDVAEAVEKEQLEVETGRKIISDSVNSRKIGETRKAEEKGVVKLIDRDFEDGGLLDNLDSREILDVKAFVLKESRESPDKSVGEIYDQVLKPFEEARVFDWMGTAEVIDPLRRIREAEFDPEEIAARIPESDVAIQILNDAGQPVTEANIKYVLKQRGVNAGD